ncbi:MAG TPA: hypothetical protein VGR16_01690, partial [Thermomicrobiales bacterium]|nr:hypothetical protein [Thermomicrobiales bacterium]
MRNVPTSFWHRTRRPVQAWHHRVAVAQGGYYLITGIWPLLHMRSFEAISGPKTDRWLVKTAGVLITAIGATLLIADRRERAATPEATVLATGSALGLTAIDVIYASKRRISPVYLLDAAA